MAYYYAYVGISIYFGDRGAAKILKYTSWDRNSGYNIAGLPSQRGGATGTPYYFGSTESAQSWDPLREPIENPT